MEEGTDKLSITGIKDKYSVDFSLKDGSHCTVSNGYLLVTSPYEDFVDELTITVTGYDTWGKYRRGNSQYNIGSYTLEIKYDSTLVDPNEQPPNPDEDNDLTLEERFNSIVGYYQGWYTATQGITGGAIGIHRTNGLLNDEDALNMYAELATNCSKDKQGVVQRTYTVDDIRSIIEKHDEEYIAIYMFGPLRENPSVEDGLYTMTVTYNEEASSFEFTGKDWIQHDTYQFVDLKQMKFQQDTLLSTVYQHSWFSYVVTGELSMVRYTPSFEQ